MVSFKLLKIFEKWYLNTLISTFKYLNQLVSVQIKHFLGKLHLFLTFFSQFCYLFLLFASNISFLSSLLNCYMSLFFSACFNIPDQVPMVINLNNQHMMPALIVPGMVFTADTSAGSSVLTHIMSEIGRAMALWTHTLISDIWLNRCKKVHESKVFFNSCFATFRGWADKCDAHACAVIPTGSVHTGGHCLALLRQAWIFPGSPLHSS